MKNSTRPLAVIGFFPARLLTGTVAQHPNPKCPAETSIGPASVRFFPLDQSVVADEWETNLPMLSFQKGLCGGIRGVSMRE